MSRDTARAIIYGSAGFTLGGTLLGHATPWLLAAYLACTCATVVGYWRYGR